jgi:PAS domain S-box-containing protein
MATVRRYAAVANRVIYDALKYPVLRYLLALVIFTLALALRLAIFPLDAGFPFFTFYPAVVLTALVCGTGPALLGIVVSAFVCDFILISPAWTVTLTYQALASITVYAVASVLICLMIQTSRRKAVERSLLASIIQSADVAVISKTLLRGEIASWNPEAERLFGYTSSEMLGKSMSTLFPPDRMGEETELLARLRRGESVVGYDTARIRKDGTAIAVSVSLSPIYDKFGRITGAAQFAHDITQQKALEDGLKRSNQNLIAAVKDLKRSNKELDEFAYIASHDLKEPLRGIHNYVSFLQEDYAASLDDEGRGYLDRIQRLAVRMTELTDCLLSLSRIGSAPLAMESVNLDQVLDGVVEDVKPLLGLLSVELRRSGHLPIVTGNALRIREVFQNLIVNAAKYNDKKEKLVEVGWEVKEATPVFYVRDNGIGIPQQHRENIFRIFKRLHEQNKFGGGTGAGLTIAKKIVERHGGRIWVESSVGVGTTFFFTLQEGL